MIPIILPVRNLSWMTINLLKSLEAYTRFPHDITVIIIDNGSTKKELGKLEKYISTCGLNVQHKIYDKPLGFVKAVNEGIRIVLENEDRYFFVFNNDTIVGTEGWLDNMMDTLSKKGVGLVGAMTSPPDVKKNPNVEKILNEKTPFEDMDSMLAPYGAKLMEALQGMDKETRFAPFFGTGFRTEMVKEIGLLDEDFDMGLFDDDDYCLRAKGAGYKIMLRQDTFIHHFHNATFDEHDIDYDGLLKKNRQLFIDKHGFDPWEKDGSN